MPPNTTHAPRSRKRADRISAQRIAGVNADADHIAGLDPVEIERLESLIADLRIAEMVWSRRCQDIQPARSDDGRPEGHVARVNQMNSDVGPLCSRNCRFKVAKGVGSFTKAACLVYHLGTKLPK